MERAASYVAAGSFILGVLALLDGSFRDASICAGVGTLAAIVFLAYRPFRPR